MSFPSRLRKVGAGVALALCLLAPSAGPAALAQVATATPTPLPKGAFFPDVIVGNPTGPTPVAGGINAQAISIDGTPVVVSGSTPTVTPAPTDTPQPTETPRATDTPIPAPTLVATSTPVTSFNLTGRGEYAQGAAVTAANNLTLGTDGNYFEVAGATQINLLCNTNWQGGSHVVLYFQSSPLVKNNQVASGCFKPINMTGAADLQAGAGFTLNLFYDSTNAAWYQVNIQATVTPQPTVTPQSTPTAAPTCALANVLEGKGSQGIQCGPVTLTTATPITGAIVVALGASQIGYATPTATPAGASGNCTGYPCGNGLPDIGPTFATITTTMTNAGTYYTGASLAALTAGDVYDVSGCINIQPAGATDNLVGRIFDSTNSVVIADGGTKTPSQSQYSICITPVQYSGFAGTPTLVIQADDTTTSGSTIENTAGTANKATWLQARRVA